MNRIRTLLDSRQGRKLLVPFFTAGFPTLDDSGTLIRTAAECGADFIEIGIPFSDPLADGPQIQHSSQVALTQGSTLPAILKFAQRMRHEVSVPLVFMGYYNPILACGLESFCRNAAQWVDGLIVPDLPVEEGSELKSAAEAEGMSVLFLVAPTSSVERIAKISKASTDLVYAVMLRGVTGSATNDKDTAAYLRRLKKHLTKPFIAGFGISTAERAKQIVEYADGVVVGSVLAALIRESSDFAAGQKKVAALLNSLRSAIDQ